MGKAFTEKELDELAEEFRRSYTTLPRFTRSRGVPYMMLKSHLKQQGKCDVMNSSKAGERKVILNELRESGLAVKEFSLKKGIARECLQTWLNEDRQQRTHRNPEEWKELIDEFFKNDFLTMYDFARAKGVSGERMSYWLDKFDPEKRWKTHGDRVKRKHIEEFAESTLTVPQFAKRKGINDETFRSWLRELDPERKIENRGPIPTYSPEEKVSLVEEFERSGMTVKEFAKSKGIKKPTFGGWVTKERKRKAGE